MTPADRGIFAETFMIILMALALGLYTDSILARESSNNPSQYLGEHPPGDSLQLFAPDRISTCDLHSGVYFADNGKEVYFSKYYGDYTKYDGAWKIVCMKEKDGLWNAPTVVMNGLTPFLAPDNKHLFFSCQHSWNIWTTERHGETWTEPRNLGPIINSSERQDVPCITNDSTLYFCAKYGQSMGIYRSRLIQGQYSQPEKLGFGINSDYHDYGPFVDPNETYVIFTSFRPGSYGLGDLYISFHLNDDTWTMPVNMGPRINTKFKERFPSVSPDGEYLFLNSNRPSKLNKKPIPDGPGNIFWINARIIGQLRKNVIR
jgi:hypothetical protein